MTKIGNLNTLKIIKIVDFGVYLDGENLGEILLPKRYVPQDSKIDDMVEVFIYFDSENRLIATTEKPNIMVGDCAYMKVISINDSVGAFLDWGLQKDLLVPFSEQRRKMELNKSYVVYAYLDDRTQRIVASTKVNKYLNQEENQKIKYEQDQKVELLIIEETNLGYKAVVDNCRVGLLYKNEIFKPLKEGQRMQGFVRKIREDGKIDLYLNKSNYQYISVHSEEILKYLKSQGGFANLNDKTPPVTIYKIFGISKKVFKNSLGDLYKKKLIKIEPTGVRIISNT